MFPSLNLDRYLTNLLFKQALRKAYADGCYSKLAKIISSLQTQKQLAVLYVN